MPQNPNTLLFGRYNREDCGLPPLKNPALARWKTTIRTVLLLAAVILGGWLAGNLAARSRMLGMDALPAAAAEAVQSATGNARAVLSRGRMLATALRGDPRAALGLAEAAYVVANNAPRQIGYYGNIDALLSGAGEKLVASPFLAFRAELLHSAVLLELRRHEEALAALKRANDALETIPDGPLARAFKLNVVNQQAYILAISDSPQVSNPEKALHLAELMIASQDAFPDGSFASSSAAFVDTLAAAWFATGQSEKALEVQSLALGLALPGELAVYLKHYDQYASAEPSRSPRLMAGGWQDF